MVKKFTTPFLMAIPGFEVSKNLAVARYQQSDFCERRDALVTLDEPEC